MGAKSERAGRPAGWMQVRMIAWNFNNNGDNNNGDGHYLIANAPRGGPGDLLARG
jgi:hypothetical protein